MQLFESLESRVLFSAGTVDSTFGVDGQITTPIGNENPGITVLANGKFILAGETNNNGKVSGSQMALYNAKGTINHSFGDDGRVLLRYGGKPVTVDAVAAAAKSEILVLETASGGREYLFRYFADGSMDTQFGVGGKVALPKGIDATQIKLDSVGRIVLGAVYAPQLPNGEIAVDGTYPLTLLRFSPAGRPDKTFGKSGVDITEFPLNIWTPNIQPLANGKIMALAQDGFYNDGVARFNSDGSLDTSYAGDGMAAIPSSAAQNVGGSTVTFAYAPPNSVAAQFQADGSVVIAYNGNGVNVSRFTAQGVLDTSFGSAGSTSVPFTNSPIGVFIESNGDYLVAGTTVRAYVNQNEYDNIGIARLTANGSLDSTFGNQGIVINDDTPEIGAGSSAIDGSRVLVEPDVVAQSRLLVAAYSI